jgi:hypothetical protein
MTHTAPPVYPPPTLLEKVAGYFKSVSDDFYTLYERVKDVWLLGTHLRWPFYWLYFYFKNVSDNLYTVDHTIRRLKQWIDGIIEGTVFEDLIDWLSYHFRTIRIDPVGWVKARFANISHEAWQLLYVPSVWVFDRIKSWLPWWDDFRYNPSKFIIDRITLSYPWLGSFLSNVVSFISDRVFEGIAFLRNLRDNPQQTIIDWLTSWYIWIREFLSNPMWFIIQKIKDYSVEVRLMIDDPYAWVKSKIKNIMGWSDFDISDITFYVFSRFLQRANDYVEQRYNQVRDVAVDIIMRFM